MGDKIKRLARHRLVRWIAVGFAFAGLSLGLLKVMGGVLAWPYVVATFCSGVICTVFRFLVVDRWVFGHPRPTWKRLWQYNFANAAGFCVWWSAANVLKSIGVNYLLASMLAMFFSIGFSLHSNFFWIWRKPAAAVNSE